MRYSTQRLWVAAAAGLLIVTFCAYQLGTHQGYKHLQQRATFQLNNFMGFIESSLRNFERIPATLSNNDLLVSRLRDPGNVDIQKEVDAYLEELKIITDASDIYLVNESGLTIAASNWRERITFIGRDLSFRPYFKEAMKGKLAWSFGLGTASAKRGYYLSYPIKDEQTILGVVVVKVRVDQLESNWSAAVTGGDVKYAIADDKNIIFLSTERQWRLHSLFSLNEEQRHMLDTSNQYAGHPIKNLGAKNERLPNFLNKQKFQQLTVPNEADVKIPYLVRIQPGPDATWRAMVFVDLHALTSHRNMVLVTTISCYLLVAMILLYLAKRSNTIKLLKQARGKLESQVKDRTRDITETNQRLLTEIDKKESALRQLKQTQDELIQASKLALIGNLSASINHELNQPLTALTGYTQSTLSILAAEKPDLVRSNLEEIAALTSHMKNIVGQFKTFTRKSSGRPMPMYPLEALNAALRIMKNPFSVAAIEYQLSFPEDPLVVMGELVRLEQVFVNIFTNAMHAMNQTREKRLNIIGQRLQDTVVIEIQDSGPGIPGDDIDQIFRPFFTTKDESHGLGLGLSISRGIIDSMQGTLTAHNHPDGGAVFCIKLPAINV